MDKIKFDFPWKHSRFILEAIKYRIHSYNSQLENNNLTEDEISDIQNDLMLLKGIEKELEEKIKKFEAR